MKRKSILFGVFLSLLGIASFGQNPLSMKISAFEEVQYRTSAEQKGLQSIPATGNQVYIQQVGIGNYAKARITSENSRIDYRQQGNFNYINFDVQATNVERIIHQNGDSNRAFGFMSVASETSGLQLSQNGNNQHFEQFGSNSIARKMQLKMNGDTNSIIVRNFK